ncbi:MAG TPA: hypothetical protein VLG16_01170 [Candidatus Saccharimonadales bacterium]|nr:hypothetical protein [Candidatus Saccharimonadales bacterium]
MSRTTAEAFAPSQLLLPETTVPSHAIDPTQFGNIAQRQFLKFANGEDPRPAAQRIEAAWLRLDPISTALDTEEREGHVLVAALDKAGEVLDAAVHESRPKERQALGETALGFKMDAIQTGLILRDTDKKVIQARTSDMLGDMREKEDRARRSEQELFYTEVFDILNTKALDIQAQAEVVRTLPANIASSGRAIAQASLGGLIQESTTYLRKIGDDYLTRKAEGENVSRQDGRFTELTFFTKRLLDWYDAGITEGDSVRMAVSREDRPRLAKVFTKMTRRSFDIVTRSVAHPEEASLIQVKSSSNLGGTKYDAPIELWRPAQAGVAEFAPDIATAFETIVANENDAAIRLARNRLAQLLE